MNGKAVPHSAPQKALAFVLTSLWDFLKSGSSMKAFIPLPVLLKYSQTNLDLEGEGGKGPLDNLVRLCAYHTTLRFPLHWTPEPALRLKYVFSKGIQAVTHP